MLTKADVVQALNFHLQNKNIRKAKIVQRLLWIHHKYCVKCNYFFFLLHFVTDH